MRSPQPAPHSFSGPWQLFGWALRGRPRLLAALAAALLGVLACEVSVPRLLAECIDAALVSKDAHRLNLAGLAIVAAIVALYFVHVVYIRLETRLLYDAMFRLRSLLCRRILEQPLDFFGRARTGALTHIVLNDTEVLENHGVYVFSDVPFGLLTIVAILALMLAMDWQMALAVVGFLAVATAASFRLGRPLPTLRKTIQTIASRLSARLAESVSGIRTVKAFGRVDDERARLDELNREVMTLEVKEGLLGAWVEPLLELMELLGVALVVWFGAHRVLEGAMTPGVLVAFIAYMELLSEPVSRAGRYVRHIQSSRGVMQRIVQFLDDLAPPPVHGTRTGPAARAPVELNHVSYAYPGMQRPALRDVDLSVLPGEFVAIVGRNGAGKSTLVEVLLGFRNPQSGTVTVGGIPVGDWEPSAWQRLVGVFPQEVFLFHASLSENIAYARPDALREQVQHAAQQAGLARLIERLPEGLETLVGDRGQKLSGGERQRVALARLLLRDPAIVVLDEPTSALDGEATRDIGRLVKDLSASRSVLVVAHRAETVALASRVLILEEGAVAFDGPLEQARRQPLFLHLFPGMHLVADGAARAPAKSR